MSTTYDHTAPTSPEPSVHETVTPSGEPVGAKRTKLSLPPPVPSNVQILGTGPAAAPAVVDVLENLGVLSR